MMEMVQVQDTRVYLSMNKIPITFLNVFITF
jgi:hypothetical protein